MNNTDSSFKKSIRKLRSRSFGSRSHASSSTTSFPALPERPVKKGFVYIDEVSIDEELKCTMCKLPLMCPVVTACCRSTCCKACISKSSECPECKGTYNPLTDPPKLVINILAKIEVKCITCEKRIKRDDFENHFNNSCEIDCPWGCNAKVISGKIESHEVQCTMQPVVCPAADIGCAKKIPRGDLDAHVASCSYAMSRPFIDRINKLESAVKSMEASVKRNETALALFLENSNHSHKDLVNKDLNGLNFTGSDFTNSNLSGANLSNCNFTRANFTKANLTDANLTNANLTKAILLGTNLTNAKLTKATLQCTEGCRQAFRFGDTKYHPGRFKFMSEWSCCDKGDLTAPGCQTCNHKIQ